VDAAAVLFELEFCITRRAVTHLALDQGAEMDENEVSAARRVVRLLAPA
jgi:hypothetical protein